MSANPVVDSEEAAFQVMTRIMEFDIPPRTRPIISAVAMFTYLGDDIDLETLVRATGGSPNMVRKYVGQLIECNVLSWTPDGIRIVAPGWDG